MTDTEQLIHDLKQLGKYSRLEPNYLLLAAEKIEELSGKQIPKKPKIHGYREGREINTISYTCSVCNKHIGRENFCKHCGTALDWSDTK